MWAWSSLLLPPIAVVFYVLHWRQSWQLFTIHAVGVVLFVIGSILFVRVHPDWIEDTWLVYMRDNLAPASLNRPLDVELDEFASRKEVSPFIGRIDGVIGGRLFGEGVYIDNVELTEGILRFKRGEGFFPQREVAIFLGITEFDVNDEWELQVNPTTKNPPLIHISRFDARTEKLQTKVVDSGYWLELELGDRRLNQLSGFVRLLLPGDSRDFMAGNFESYTNKIRYDLGDVDRFFDSNDTIEYVASLHLETRFKKAVEKVKFYDTHYAAHIALPTAETIAELTLIDGTLHTIALDLFKGQQGWTVDTESTDDLRQAIAALIDEPPVAGPINIEETTNVFSGKDYQALIGREIQVTANGKIRKGRLESVEKAQLVLHQMLQDGYLNYHVPKRLVDEVVILN